MSVILSVMFDDDLPLAELAGCILDLLEDVDFGDRSLPIDQNVQLSLPGPFSGDYALTIRMFERPDGLDSLTTLRADVD